MFSMVSSMLQSEGSNEHSKIKEIIRLLREIFYVQFKSQKLG